MNFDGDALVLDKVRVLLGIFIGIPFFLIQCYELSFLFYTLYRLVRFQYCVGWDSWTGAELKGPIQLADGTSEFDMWHHDQNGNADESSDNEDED